MVLGFAVVVLLMVGVVAQDELASTNKLATHEDQPAIVRAKNNIFFSAMSGQHTDDSTECYQVEVVDRGGPMDPKRRESEIKKVLEEYARPHNAGRMFYDVAEKPCSGRPSKYGLRYFEIKKETLVGCPESAGEDIRCETWAPH